jgi:hypothetical protein
MSANANIRHVGELTSGGILAFQLPAQAIPVRDVKCLRGFKLNQKRASGLTIMSVALKLGDQLFLSRNVPVAAGNRLFCLNEILFPDCVVHRRKLPKTAKARIDLDQFS